MAMSRKDLEALDDRAMATWSDHDADGWVALFADDFIWHDWTTPEAIRTKEGARGYFSAWMTAVPDMKVRTVMRVVGEDSVAAEIEFSGTNSGPMAMGGMEMPATNKPLVGRGSYLARAKDGKIVEFRSHPDAAGIMMQLGLMPGM
jgi:steroid delta-isomerase-like uncharacterized protein